MKTFDAFKDAIQFLEQATSQTYLQCKIEAEEIFSHVMDYEKYVDYELIFQKAFLDPLDNILKPIGWHTEPQATLEDLFA